MSGADAPRGHDDVHLVTGLSEAQQAEARSVFAALNVTRADATSGRRRTSRPPRCCATS